MEEVELRSPDEPPLRISLPAELCEDQQLFRHTLVRGWQMLTPESQRNLINRYILNKSAIKSSHHHQEGIVQMILYRDVRFNEPLTLFHSWLKLGLLMPTICHLHCLDVAMQYSNYQSMVIERNVQSLQECLTAKQVIAHDVASGNIRIHELCDLFDHKAKNVSKNVKSLPSVGHSLTPSGNTIKSEAFDYAVKLEAKQNKHGRKNMPNHNNNLLTTASQSQAPVSLPSQSNEYPVQLGRRRYLETMQRLQSELNNSVHMQLSTTKQQKLASPMMIHLNPHLSFVTSSDEDDVTLDGATNADGSFDNSFTNCHTPPMSPQQQKLLIPSNGPLRMSPLLHSPTMMHSSSGAKTATQLSSSSLFTNVLVATGQNHMSPTPQLQLQGAASPQNQNTLKSILMPSVQLSPTQQQRLSSIAQSTVSQSMVPHKQRSRKRRLELGTGRRPYELQDEELADVIQRVSVDECASSMGKVAAAASQSHRRYVSPAIMSIGSDRAYVGLLAKALAERNDDVADRALTAEMKRIRNRCRTTIDRLAFAYPTSAVSFGLARHLTFFDAIRCFMLSGQNATEGVTVAQVEQAVREWQQYVPNFAKRQSGWVNDLTRHPPHVNALQIAVTQPNTPQLKRGAPAPQQLPAGKQGTTSQSTCWSQVACHALNFLATRGSYWHQAYSTCDVKVPDFDPLVEAKNGKFFWKDPPAGGSSNVAQPSTSLSTSMPSFMTFPTPCTELKAVYHAWLKVQSSSTLQLPRLHHTVEMSPSNTPHSGKANVGASPGTLANLTPKPPPPISEEVAHYRSQEVDRYAHPNLPFTFTYSPLLVNSFVQEHKKTPGAPTPALQQTCVGPVRGFEPSNKGAAQKLAKVAADNKKERKPHKILTPDRPAYINALQLVRDAAARLPNGEGTKVDICDLLRSSRYIKHDAQQSDITQAVSGALDRLIREPDPCIRCEKPRNIWVYLHKRRSEQDFMGPAPGQATPPVPITTAPKPPTPSSLPKSSTPTATPNFLNKRQSEGTPRSGAGSVGPPSTPTPQPQVPTPTAQELGPVFSSASSLGVAMPPHSSQVTLPQQSVGMPMGSYGGPSSTAMGMVMTSGSGVGVSNHLHNAAPTLAGITPSTQQPSQLPTQSTLR